MNNTSLLQGRLSVIMPAYNESLSIFHNLQETVETLYALGYDFEIIVVDDGSSDSTAIQAARLISGHPEVVRVVRYDKNHGKGNALICGASYATGDFIVFLDADMDLHPRQLPVLLEMLNSQGADVVIGSKRHPLSNVAYPAVRRLYSAVYYFLIRMLFGLPVRDTQTGLKVFKAKVLKRVFPRITIKRFAFDIEVLVNAHACGYKIVEAPITLTFQRPFGRIGKADITRMLVDTLAIFYRLYITRYYDRVPDTELTSLPAVAEARELSAV